MENYGNKAVFFALTHTKLSEYSVGKQNLGIQQTLCPVFCPPILSRFPPDPDTSEISLVEIWDLGGSLIIT